MPVYLKVLLLMLSATHFTSIAKEIDLAEALNPGNLSAQLINPSDNNKGLLVLLPGCGQSAVEFSKSGGFSELAEQKDLTVLAIQQKKENNIQACFNWFSDLDSHNGKGEFQSIINFIDAVKHDQPVYLIGLSAGGAMASALVLQKPDYFSAAAIIAGIAFPCANNIVQAISCMKNGPNLSGKELAGIVSQKFENAPKSWPELAIITGTKDPIVNGVNSERMADQYVELVNAERQDSSEVVVGLSQTVWTFANNKKLALIQYEGLGHGFPISSAATGQSKTSPFYLPSKKGASDVLMELWF